MMTRRHVPVLLEEALRLLDPRPGDVVVDLTAGLGGHSAAILKRIGPDGLVIGMDLDPANLDVAAEIARAAGGRFEAVRASFVTAPEILRARSLRADVMLADLGFSSSQMDDPARGFSFRRDGPLDMRFDPDQTTTAADLVNTLPQRELADLIHRFGEEPMARRIAQKLAQSRELESINTTDKLARLVREAYGPRARASRMDPATRTFMALRIAVNDELGALQALLGSLEREALRVATDVEEERWLSRGARIGVISFHSLEDRLVKRAFAGLAKRNLVTALTKKPVTAGDEEVASNPRSRSAKLRAIRCEPTARKDE